jgi:hypothetical protein
MQPRLFIVTLFVFLVCIGCVGKGQILLEPTFNEQYVPKDTLEKMISKVLMFYPELSRKQLRIRQVKQWIPLTSTPSVLNIFRKKENWRYTIDISTKTFSKYEGILFRNLSDSAKVGVLSHEISHALDFQTHNKGYIFSIFFGHLSKKRMDTFEFETDHLVIKRGLGRYLLAWSSLVRERLDITKFPQNSTKKPENERYMSPETIRLYLQKYPELYGK